MLKKNFKSKDFTPLGMESVMKWESKKKTPFESVSEKASDNNREEKELGPQVRKW